MITEEEEEEEEENLQREKKSPDAELRRRHQWHEHCDVWAFLTSLSVVILRLFLEGAGAVQ